MSVLEITLILFYTILFCIIILKTKFFQSDYVSKQFIVKLFLLKIVVAYIYAFIHFENSWRDTFVMFLSAKQIAQLVIDHPDVYFQFVFGKVDQPFSTEISALIGADHLLKYGQARSDFMVRLSAFFLPICYGYYSVLCVFFEFFSLLGIFYIYEFLVKRISVNHNLLKLFLFFAPSILFWLSGFHKDGLTILGLVLILHSVDQISEGNWTYILLAAFGFMFSYLIRDYALFIFIPAFVSLLIAQQLKKGILLPYLLIYGLSVLFFFTGNQLHPKFNFPERFVAYQAAFQELEGGSNYDMIPLEPTVESFASTGPIALLNTLLKPNLSQSDTFWSVIAAVENIFYILVGLLMLIFMNFKRYHQKQKALLMFLAFFGLSYFLVLGLIVDNLGAIVRYKTTPLVFLGAAIILLFDVNRFEQFFSIKNKFISTYVGE